MKINEILLATNNQGKVKEMKSIMSDLGINVYSLKDKGIDVEVEEDGKTFEENAVKKAEEIAKISGMITVSDDSGLEVYALDLRPGIYSARYAGEGATSEMLCNKLLDELKNVPHDKRGARFVSVVVVVYPDGTKLALRGECEGSITMEPKGSGGFGYDPVFYVDDYSMTFAEMPLEEKNKISHRAKAFFKLKDHLKAELNN
ncbi:MAG: XTP/dITP diphosphatase [Clostridia bacterium]|nr:XTP/dITP diphosphatase [Clostridia bacterium]